jgi:hypothetical protein
MAELRGIRAPRYNTPLKIRLSLPPPSSIILPACFLIIEQVEATCILFNPKKPLSLWWHLNTLEGYPALPPLREVFHPHRPPAFESDVSLPVDQ